MTGPPAEGSRVDWADVPEQVRTEIERACGARVVEAVTAPGGFSPGLAARITCGDGRQWFVKAASGQVNPDTPRLHRQEAGILRGLDPLIRSGRLSAPRLRATAEHGSWFEDPGSGARRVRLIVGVRSTGSSGRGDPGSSPRARQRQLADLAQDLLHVDPAQGRIQVDEAPWWVREDVVDYVTSLLRVSPASPYHDDETSVTKAVAEVLVDAAGTSFLFAKMAAEQLTARIQVVDVHDPAWRTSISQGVLGVFREDLHRTLPDPEDRLRAVHLLRAVAFAFGPGLPWRNIWPLVANAVADDPGRYGDTDIAWLLQTRLGGYLVADRADGVTVYRLFHDDLRTILYERWTELLAP